MADIRRVYREGTNVVFVVTLNEHNYNGLLLSDVADSVAGWLSRESGSTVYIMPSTTHSKTYGNKHELYISFNNVGFMSFCRSHSLSDITSKIYSICELSFDLVLETEIIMHEQTHPKVERSSK